MIHFFIKQNQPSVAAIGLLLAFAGTCILTAKLSNLLPRDGGREFAVEGKLSAGKPRGAGIIFILVFTVAALLFAQVSLETVIYLILIMAEMLTGFMDDAAERPWGGLKKGLLDLTIPPLLFGILTVALVWGSINVTNCSDGVDGLSGTLAIITLATFYVIDNITGKDDFTFLILIFIICILGYLWYNATPSRLMMGDAGSRAMGIFISITALKSGSPFMYLPVAMVFILDGGLGLLKVGLIKTCKIHILNHVRTPLHDHVRKNMGWSNTQTVVRFAIIQIVVSLAMVYAVLL